MWQALFYYKLFFIEYDEFIFYFKFIFCEHLQKIKTRFNLASAYNNQEV